MPAEVPAAETDAGGDGNVDIELPVINAPAASSVSILLFGKRKYLKVDTNE